MPYYQVGNNIPVYFPSMASAHELPIGAIILTDEEANAQMPTPLNLAKANQTTLVDTGCAISIVSGFKSNALGATYLYPAQPTDQANLQSSVISSMLPNLPSTWTTPFWCTDASGNANFRPHTAAQIQQVGTDAKARVMACLYQKAVLETQIANAGTAELVATYVWTDPA